MYGVYRGVYSFKLSQNIFKNIHAFEPNPNISFHILEKNLKKIIKYKII